MPGSKIPVLEVEKISTLYGGRGIVLTDDATNFDVQTWTGSGTTGALPAASATAWMRVTSDAGTSYYVPLFHTVW